MRRGVRAGRRSTVGNRVGRVFVLEGSNPSLSATLAGITMKQVFKDQLVTDFLKYCYVSEYSALSGRKYVRYIYWRNL